MAQRSLPVPSNLFSRSYRGSYWECFCVISRSVGGSGEWPSQVTHLDVCKSCGIRRDGYLLLTVPEIRLKLLSRSMLYGESLYHLVIQRFTKCLEAALSALARQYILISHMESSESWCGMEADPEAEECIVGSGLPLAYTSMQGAIGRWQQLSLSHHNSSTFSLSSQLEESSGDHQYQG